MSGPKMGASHQPPAGADRDRLACPLVGVTALIDSRTNSSTAYCDVDDKHAVLRLQITFVAADPPQVSYFCAYCPGYSFTEEPTIINTEGNLALLHIGLAKEYSFGLDRYAFYVYHASGGPNGEPSLTMLPQPSGRRITERWGNFGLLPGGTQDTGAGGYHVAALFVDSEAMDFQLYLYSSKKGQWTLKNPVLILNEQQQLAGEFRHITYAVITVGGDYGTMGFVDYSRGILFCNVLQGDSPNLYYVPLPALHSRLDRHDAWRVCNIAVDTTGGRIRFAKLFHDEKTADWHTVVWSRSAANYLDGWRQDCNILPSQLLCGNLPEQLPRGSCCDDHPGPPPPTTLDLYRMCTVFPTLSLLDDNTLYLMISRQFGAWDWWVIAVDMANKTLQDVAHYRPDTSTLTFRHSKISYHLNTSASPGAKGYIKRPGAEILEPSSKKQCILSMMDDMVSSWVGEHGQYQDAGTIEGDQYGDDMDLDMTTLLNKH